MPNEKTITSQVAFYSHEDLSLESWSPTLMLRWKLKNENMDSLQFGLIKTDKVLQQMWQGSNGNQKWEDIPVVYEEK